MPTPPRSQSRSTGAPPVTLVGLASASGIPEFLMLGFLLPGYDAAIMPTLNKPLPTALHYSFLLTALLSLSRPNVADDAKPPVAQPPPPKIPDDPLKTGYI